MNFNNLINESLSLEIIEPYLLSLTKDSYSSDMTLEEFTLIIEENMSSLLRLFKNTFINISFTEEDYLNKVEEYKDLLESDDSIKKVTLKELKNHKKLINTIKNSSDKIDFLKSILNNDNRIDLDKPSFIWYLSQIFWEVPLLVNQDLFRKTSRTLNTLEVPISDLNLEWFYYQNELEKGLKYFQSILEKAIQEQVNSDYKYKSINLYLLWNLINRNLTQEQDFQESLVNYNLTFEVSFFLLKMYFILKEYFPEVTYTFSLEKKNFRLFELEKEHIRNYNINFERIISKLLTSKLEKYNLEKSIKDLEDNNFYNQEVLKNWVCTISYGSYKSQDYKKDLEVNLIEKRILKDSKSKSMIRSSRIYIWWKNLLITTDWHRRIRRIPSLFHFNETNENLVFFDINKDWEEKQKIWVTPTDEVKIEFSKIDEKDDIKFYDFIKKTILTPKRDKKQITIFT